jgi:hypothetical protein
MQLNTESLKTVREADYDPETRMVKLTIVCTPDDLIVAGGASAIDMDLDEVRLAIDQVDKYETGVGV